MFGKQFILLKDIGGRYIFWIIFEAFSYLLAQDATGTLALGNQINPASCFAVLSQSQLLFSQYPPHLLSVSSRAEEQLRMLDLSDFPLKPRLKV